MEKLSKMPEVKQSSGTTLHEETHTMKQDGTASAASPSSSSQHMPTGSDKMSTTETATPKQSQVVHPVHHEDSKVVHVYESDEHDEVATPQVPRDQVVKNNPRIPDVTKPVEPAKSKEQLKAEEMAKIVAEQRAMDTLTHKKEMAHLPPFPKAMDDKIDVLTLSYTQYNKDGFKIEEVVKFIIECVFELVELTHMYTNIPDERKKQVVLSSVQKMYKSHNPDIPWIPEMVETMIESMFFDHIVPVLYDQLVKHVQHEKIVQTEKFEQVKSQMEMEKSKMAEPKMAEYTPMVDTKPFVK